MTKISSLTALTGAGVDTAADLLPIVDMSETSTARNKKITIDELAIALKEGIDDRVAALLVAGTNVSLSYDDVANTLTISAGTPAPGDITGFNEAVDDRVAALLIAGSGISKAYNDSAGTLTLTASGNESAIEWAPNWTGDADWYLPAAVAMTIDEGNAALGTGTLAIEKSTSAAPGTFAAASFPVMLEAGAWLKIGATGVSSFLAAHLVRTA